MALAGSFPFTPMDDTWSGKCKIGGGGCGGGSGCGGGFGDGDGYGGAT